MLPTIDMRVKKYFRTVIFISEVTEKTIILSFDNFNKNETLEKRHFHKNVMRNILTCEVLKKRKEKFRSGKYCLREEVLGRICGFSSTSRIIYLGVFYKILTNGRFLLIFCVLFNGINFSQSSHLDNRLHLT